MAEHGLEQHRDGGERRAEPGPAGPPEPAEHTVERSADETAEPPGPLAAHRRGDHPHRRVHALHRAVDHQYVADHGQPRRGEPEPGGTQPDRARPGSTGPDCLRGPGRERQQQPRRRHAADRGGEVREQRADVLIQGAEREGRGENQQADGAARPRPARARVRLSSAVVMPAGPSVFAAGYREWCCARAERRARKRPVT